MSAAEVNLDERAATKFAKAVMPEVVRFLLRHGVTPTEAQFKKIAVACAPRFEELTRGWEALSEEGLGNLLVTALIEAEAIAAIVCGLRPSTETVKA